MPQKTLFSCLRVHFVQVLFYKNFTSFIYFWLVTFLIFYFAFILFSWFFFLLSFSFTFSVFIFFTINYFPIFSSFSTCFTVKRFHYHFISKKGALQNCYILAKINPWFFQEHWLRHIIQLKHPYSKHFEMLRIWKW